MAAVVPPPRLSHTHGEQALSIVSSHCMHITISLAVDTNKHGTLKQQRSVQQRLIRERFFTF